MITFPMELVVDLQKYNQPYKLTAVVDKTGILTNFLNGEGPSPEPRVTLVLSHAGDETVIYVTDASAVPLVDDLTETMLMSIFVYQVIFGTYAKTRQNSGENRREALLVCEAYVKARTKADQLLPQVVRHQRHPLKLSIGLVEFANIKLNQYYHINEFEYRGYKVWLKRRLYRGGDSWNFALTSRWSFVATNKYTCSITNSEISYEDKHVIALNEYMPSQLFTFEQACKEFDELNPPAQ